MTISGEYFAEGSQLAELLAGVGGEGEVEAQLGQVGGELQVGAVVGLRAAEVERLAHQVSDNRKG